ncbi:helix-turn-helix transcriptional regulator [Zemynaea arenosa]|nr:YafY family protein [Massilia arenosa]
MATKSSRLLLLMDALRGHRRPVTAAQLAEKTGVSERTIYRDLQALAELGAPVQGEAGVGYMLKPGMFLPPLMFNADELEALVLGARWVARQGDTELAAAARGVLAKVATASPQDLRDRIAETSLWTPVYHTPLPEDFLAAVRLAIRRERKLRIAYRSEAGQDSERVVWPFALAYLDQYRVLAAWCELRGGFRHFRVDRIGAAHTLDEVYPTRRHELLKTWRAEKGIAEPPDRI